MSSLTWLNQEIQLMAQQYAAELVSKKIESVIHCIIKIDVDFHKLLESDSSTNIHQTAQNDYRFQFFLESENSTEMHWNAQKQRRFS